MKGASMSICGKNLTDLECIKGKSSYIGDQLATNTEEGTALKAKGIGALAVVAIVIIVIIVGIGSYLASNGGEGVPAPAEFEVSNLVFNPSEAEVGNPVDVSVAVKNVGDLEGSYTVELKIDGTTEGSKNVTLAGGTTEIVSFTITENALGAYTIEVERLQRVLYVLEPAAFELTNLNISPAQVELGASVTISVDVRNKGGVSGTYTVVLRIDGITEATRDIALTGGETRTTSFVVTKDVVRTYNISADGLVGAFTVTGPPGVEVLSQPILFWGIF